MLVKFYFLYAIFWSIEGFSLAKISDCQVCFWGSHFIPLIQQHFFPLLSLFFLSRKEEITKFNQIFMFLFPLVSAKWRTGKHVLKNVKFKPDEVPSIPSTKRDLVIYIGRTYELYLCWFFIFLFLLAILLLSFCITFLFIFHHRLSHLCLNFFSYDFLLFPMFLLVKNSDFTHSIKALWRKSSIYLPQF